jgi:DNA-binding transcriptional MerR regulator
MTEKTIDKKRSIGDASKEIGVETHVIRFWESKFPQIKPEIGKGSRRYYFDQDIAILNKIKSLLHDEGYSIAGLQKLLKKRKNTGLKEQNVEFLLAAEGCEKVEDSQDFSLDDFIVPNNSNSIFSINEIIGRIESNLKKLEQ